jgi:protein-L-isoaspartate(D-aspartate) O-methyltransferase
MRAQRPLVMSLLIAAIVVVGYSIRQITSGAREIPPGNAQLDPEGTRPDQGSGGLFSKNHASAGDDDARREQMVRRQMAARDITDRRVLEAMGKVPRHEFVPPDQRGAAYDDRPLPIGQGQTISQPYIVALMTQLARPTPDAVALDVGTGSGYQAAVLAELCQSVFSIEIVEPLAESAKERLADLGYENVTVRCGDGYRGWPEEAPFDLIIVAAAPERVPQPLIDSNRVADWSSRWAGTARICWCSRNDRMVPCIARRWRRWLLCP